MSKVNLIADARRVNVKFERKYKKLIKKALDKTVSSLIGKIQTEGIRQAVYELQTTLISEHLSAPLLKLVREVGLYHAKANYRFLRSEISQKGFGINEMWLQDIKNILRDTLLRKSIIKVTETLRNHLIELYEQALKDGLGEDEFIQLIKEDNFTDTQAQRIVRTETNRVTNTARKATADLFDFETSKEWVSHRDMRTRGTDPKDKKDHYHMNGQTVNMDESFRDARSGELIDFPSAPGASAAMTINCRCQMVTIPKRDDDGRLIRTNRNIISRQRIIN